MLQTSLMALELPGTVPFLPSHHVLEEGLRSLHGHSHPGCDLLLPSPFPFLSLCSEQVSPSSGELDLGVKTQWQGGFAGRLQLAMCWSGAKCSLGPVVSAGNGYVMWHFPPSGDGLLSLLRGTLSLLPLPTPAAFLSFTRPHCFQNALYICYESLFPD